MICFRMLKLKFKLQKANGSYSSNNFLAVVSFPKMSAGLIIQVDIFAPPKRKQFSVSSVSKV